MVNLEARAMKNAPGVHIVARDSPAAVFDEISSALDRFYQAKDLIFYADREKKPDPKTREEIEAARQFDASTLKYKHKVYRMPEHAKDSGLVAFLNLEYDPQKSGEKSKVPEHLRNVDFAVGQFHWTESRFRLYFNLLNRKARTQERDDFVEFVKRNYLQPT